MPWTNWQHRKTDYNPKRELRRLQKDLREWKSPDHYKGFTQEQRDERIAGILRLIVSIKKRLSPEP
jgi:hypothetical protein